MKNKLSLEEYKRAINRVRNTRQPNPILPDYAKGKVRKQTVSKIQKLQGSSPGVLYGGPFKIKVEIYGKCRGDIDNVLKGILDSLNGLAYKDDRQCVDARVLLCSRNN